ncbi:MAG: cation-translocating P-type ATPase [Pseudomonadales bacterium]|jgi:Cd2+/Zn2+-exporting ATPase|nr:cation-translocating P-type ATPase [Pseudomonadales bacterium]MCP5337139.1 cation-translocating P-type ATPase [Pseudomonadales bacterium]
MESDRAVHANGRTLPGYRIETMDCAAEESEIRLAVAGVDGLRALHFDLGQRTLRIDADAAALPTILALIRKAGFDPQALSGSAGTVAATDAGPSREKLRLVLAVLLAGCAEAVVLLVPAGGVARVLTLALAVSAIALSGFSTYRKGVSALLRGRLNINALMSVAVSGALLIGEWPEAAMVMALYAIAELIEARAVDRARNAIKGLLDLAPETAESKQADGSWMSVAAAQVPVDAVVRVRPGARIPLDGVVLAGNASVNQAPVTGESLPVDKAPGDDVFAGTINETGTLELRVTAASGNTLLARIIHAVEQAQGARAPTQQFVDRFAAVYTPLVFAFAVLVAVLTPWLVGWSWMLALYKALVLLVIACPCALVIATPVTIVSGLAAAARRGVLVKGGVYLESAHRIRAVALDKTGTITEGRPRLVASEYLPSPFPEPTVMYWARVLAGHSDHPVSRAIAADTQAGNGELSGFTALAGRGIEAQTDGQRLVLGNHRLIEERGLCGAAIEARLAEHERQGRTVTMLASRTQVLAIFAVADRIKQSSRTALAELHALGVRSFMLSGDNETTARTIAAEAGIDDVRANLLPTDKLAAIRAMQQSFGVVAMAGDGINDAPALAQADIGIAMGAAGTDTAMEAADIVIMNDDLRRIPEMIRLSRRARVVLWQNIALALGIKLVFLLLAVFGSATMWMAVFADMGASLIVVFNGLRLLRGVALGADQSIAS